MLKRSLPNFRVGKVLESSGKFWKVLGAFWIFYPYP
jgi:hypothetical protein